MSSFFITDEIHSLSPLVFQGCPCHIVLRKYHQMEFQQQNKNIIVACIHQSCPYFFYVWDRKVLPSLITWKEERHVLHSLKADLSSCSLTLPQSLFLSFFLSFVNIQLCGSISRYWVRILGKGNGIWMFDKNSRWFLSSGALKRCCLSTFPLLVPHLCQLSPYFSATLHKLIKSFTDISNIILWNFIFLFSPDSFIFPLPS